MIGGIGRPVTWRTSNRSCEGSNCVAVADLVTRVTVCDTKALPTAATVSDARPELSPVLSYSAADWTQFLESVRC